MFTDRSNWKRITSSRRVGSAGYRYHPWVRSWNFHNMFFNRCDIIMSENDGLTKGQRPLLANSSCIWCFSADRDEQQELGVGRRKWTLVRLLIRSDIEQHSVKSTTFGSNGRMDVWVSRREGKKEQTNKQQEPNANERPLHLPELRRLEPFVHHWWKYYHHWRFEPFIHHWWWKYYKTSFPIVRPYHATASGHPAPEPHSGSETQIGQSLR
jgi:hypothetical protein